MDIDRAILMFINGLAGTNKFLDALFIVFAEYLILIIPIVLGYLWYKDRKLFLFTLLSMSIGLGINFLISSIYYRPRPFLVYDIKLLIYHASDSSFPSDHTTLFLTLGYYLSKKMKKLGYLLFILGFVVGFSRIYCGVHYLSDIVGSLIVSIFACEIVIKYKNKIRKSFKLFKDFKF